jgi:hypothetical protein
LSLNPASLVERHPQIAHALADGMGDRVRDCRRSSDNADLRTHCAHSSSWIAATPLPRSSRRRSSNSRACGNATLHVCVKRPCRRSHLLRSIQKRLRSKNGAGRTRLRYVGTSWPRHPSFHHLMRAADGALGVVESPRINSGVPERTKHGVLARKRLRVSENARTHERGKSEGA